MEVVIDTCLIAGLGMSGGIEQKVGDLRHRGDHGDYGAPGGFGCNQIASRFHPFGGPDAGPAELHHKESVQIFSVVPGSFQDACERCSLLCSLPLEIRARTSFRIASSTSSALMPVESI